MIPSSYLTNNNDTLKYLNLTFDFSFDLDFYPVSKQITPEMDSPPSNTS